MFEFLTSQNPNIKIGEVPVHFKKRDEGVSKRDLIKFIFTYFLTINRLLKLKNDIDGGMIADRQ